MGLFCEERTIHHDPSQLNDTSYGWQTMPELEHLRAGAVLWQPNVSCKYSAICAISQAVALGDRSPTVTATTCLACCCWRAARGSCAQLGFSALGAHLNDDKYPIAAQPGMCTLITDDD